MALERNNIALESEPGFDPEFDRMLRRHLKHGGATVVACTGFDADTANAYLEKGLGTQARGRFESHLAGCPACRHHVIELSRLVQATPQSAPALTIAKARLPRWAKWKAATSEWIDFSSWSWNWQTAGVGGAALAILITALAVQPRWQSTSPGRSPDVALAPTPSSGAGQSEAEKRERAALPESSPAPNQQPLMAGGVGQTTAPTRSTIPTPSVAAPLAESNLASNFPQSESQRRPPMMLEQTNDRNSGFPSLRQQQVNLQSFGGFSAQAPAAPPVLVRQADIAVAEPSQESAVASSEKRESEETAKVLGPLPADNPMRDDAGKSSDKLRKSPSEKKPGWIERAMAFAPGSKSKGDETPAPLSRNEEEVRPLTVRIHNRVFYRENGVWVDKEYKSEMAWRVTKLIKGSAEFERVLADDPQLKPYFDKDSIIVIWRDKIFKVVTK